MTFDEVQKSLVELLKNPDTAQAGANDFLDQLKPDYESLESATVKLTEQDKKIRDLQDTNTKLLLKLNMADDTSGVDDTDEVIIQTADDADAFLEALGNHEKED